MGVDQEYAQQRIAEAIAAREAEEGLSWEQLLKAGAAWGPFPCTHCGEPGENDDPAGYICGSCGFEYLNAETG
ncbi:hypothetical protein [Streptomyces sp. Y1]|uniref:Uncharacterized protein n=1 Tax=Streptomyces sp. Y1 TaxID=3238634 RepID=A0AB39TXQ5_9ACTN